VPGTALNLSLVLTNEQGVDLFNTVPLNEREWHGRPFPGGLFRSICYIPGGVMNDGRVNVQLYVIKDQSMTLFRHDDILSFDVLDIIELRKNWYGKWVGAVRLDLEWKTQLLETAEAERARA
jgi:lipopolysaccharide transport system ATP-binding protein